MKLKYYLSADRKVGEVSIASFKDFEAFLKGLGGGGRSEQTYKSSLQYWAAFYRELTSNEEFKPKMVGLPNREKEFNDRANKSVIIFERILE